MGVNDVARGEQKINAIAEQIIRKMPSGLSKLEQARYIYLQLGKMVTFDENYWFANTKAKQKIYKSAQKVKDFSQVSDGRVICVSLANLYNNMMKRIGIEAEVKEVERPKPPHTYSIITIDNKVYRTDLQADLKYIQSRRRTKYFGSTKGSNVYIDILPKELAEIDNRLGYFYDGERIIKNLKDRLSSEIQEYSKLEDKAKHILTITGECDVINQMGFVERLEFYNKTILDLLINENNRRITFTRMYRDSNKSRKYTECISIKQKDDKYARFIYSEKTGTYLEIAEEKLQELLSDGLKVMDGEQLPTDKKIKADRENDKTIAHDIDDKS